MELTYREQLKPPLFGDVALLAITMFLVCFSIVMVYSTTGILSQERYGDPLFFVKRQSIAVVLGFMLMVACSRVGVGNLRRLSPYLLPISIGLVLLTMISGIGDAAGGAQRWITFGSLKFQPAEISKVLFVIFFAGFLARHETALTTFSYGVVKPALFLSLLSGALLLQPDFGSVVVLGVVTLVMSAVAGVRLRYLISGGVLLVIILVPLVVFSPYRLERIVSFMSPLNDRSGKGYQLLQSLIAIGTGQMTGVGLGGSQQKLFFLPAAHTDFIFAVISEELGFLGSMGILALFSGMLWRGYVIAQRLVSDTFSFSLAVGLTGLIVFPALINVGVVIGLLPTKGMALPLVGYGGSSMISSLIVIGLLFSLSRSFRLTGSECEVRDGR